MQPYLPMLAVSSEPFDSPEYLFEVKWNGVRALAVNEPEGWRLWGRAHAEYRERYPELAGLRRLPSGTVLDGEVVQVSQGRPDFDGLLARHQLGCPSAVRWHSRQQPVNYVVFDVLRAAGRCVLGQTLEARRALAEALVHDLAEPRVSFSAGVVGAGRSLFTEAVRQGQEGVMAKHRSSRYLPGRRSSAWKKIKPLRELPCAIVGYRPGRAGVRCLLAAALHEGCLRYVGQLHSGFTAAARVELQARLAAHLRPAPVVPCRARGVWVEPVVYCRVRFLEWTRHGYLRGASFRGLLDAAGPAVPSSADGADALGPHGS